MRSLFQGRCFYAGLSEAWHLGLPPPEDGQPRQFKHTLHGPAGQTGKGFSPDPPQAQRRRDRLGTEDAFPPLGDIPLFFLGTISVVLPYSSAIASISQRTPFGRSFTATQLLAGLETKYFA